MAVEAPPAPVRPRWTAFFTDSRFLLFLIAGGVMAVVVVFVIALTSAIFTAQSKSTGNQITAGRAALQLSTSGQIVDARNMRPGDTRTGNVSVTNTGERASLSVGVIGIDNAPPLALNALRLKITEQGSSGRVLFDGALGDATSVELGTFGPNETGSWIFEISLPQDVSPAVGGSNLPNTAFRWEARTV